MACSSSIDYEAHVDCLAATAHVISHLRHESAPWMSVLIPTCRRPDLFREAIKSVLEQKPVSFAWEIVVVDNDPWDGSPNETENYIASLADGRIRYFRNSENLRPGDNFNRGILLSRGEWVMMLHDDDMLLPNTLEKMGKAIRFLERRKGRPLGAVAAQYHCFSYDASRPREKDAELKKVAEHYLNSPMSYRFFRLTHANVLFTGHPGGNIPSVGTTFNRRAVLDTGGFNEDLGICADLILFYNLESRYRVYSTLEPYGFYRWGANTMIRYESTHQTIKFCYDFREYVYRKSLFHRLWGMLFRSVHYYLFIIPVLEQRSLSSSSHVNFEDYADIYARKPNRRFFRFYRHSILSLYRRIKHLEVKRLEKKARKENLT